MSQRTALSVLLNGYLMTSDHGNPAFCGVYLVDGYDRDGHRCRLLFDSGHVGRRRHLLASLAVHGLEPTDIDVVVLSHGHWDHLQNVDLFTRARVLLHADEVSYLRAPSLLDLGTPSWAASVLDSVSVQLTGDMDEVIPGVSVVALPGHTPGSIGLAVDTDAGVAILAGDAVVAGGVATSGRAAGRPMDVAMADDSVRRVTEKADVVYPGHDRPFRFSGPGQIEYLSEPSSITFSVLDPDAMRRQITFVRHLLAADHPDRRSPG